MGGTRALLQNGVAVRLRAVALAARKAVRRVRQIELLHELVAHDLGDDGGHGDAQGLAVALHNGIMRIPQRPQGLAIDEFSRSKMDATHKELLEERDGVKDLL